MFASFLRHARRPSQHSPYSSFATRPDGDDATSDNDSSEGYNLQDEDDVEHEQDPLLPLFSSEHLDRLPVYNVTHAIRIHVVQRCETTLSWDQLRSPQVSQFLVKPIQQEIRAAQFNRATLYALLANCLQFHKEGAINPGNVGVSRTRALVCELLAVRLLREYSTRELIDALFYDFDPMQGTAYATGQGQARPLIPSKAARLSTIEVAIRAQTKKFLSHPLVVQQLEAVWAGAIVFHSAADDLHRKKPKQRVHRGRTYGALEQVAPDQSPAKSRSAPAPQRGQPGAPQDVPIRRSVTLYDPRDASLFKLSRLRVPRYRQLFSTLSFAILLGLFLAVLAKKSLDITGLEILFWFWGAGYMLDEIVGFTEQGFGLYIMSVWNSFDLGILLFLMVYYVLRLYGIIMPGERKREIATMAYNVLATTAVLLFPRLFSVLDHYRYFSQLLIAFRMMALDLMAILLLIIISCSGFFVAFTMAFSDTIPDAGSAAYTLFQILMGFTPAAWEIWDGYNYLGRSVLTLFLFICHFLIVTILITVLTNSFMAVVQNANEEHQFLFAVNAISMVKSDSLFSYVAPTNVLGWLLTPTRYFMPFRAYVKLNRTIIKLTHFPLLFTIFFYERLILSRRADEPTDLVEQRGRASQKVPAFAMGGPEDVFSPGTRLREPSVTTFQKDRALAEVFRRPFRDSTRRAAEGGEGGEGASERRKSSTVVRDWMQGMGHAGPAPPLEQPRFTIDRLESRRPSFRRATTAQRVFSSRKAAVRTPRSHRSDPEEGPGQAGSRRRSVAIVEEEYPSIRLEEPHQTDADGDDELVTNDEDDQAVSEHNADKGPVKEPQRTPEDGSDSGNDFFSTPMPHRIQSEHDSISSAHNDPQEGRPASFNPRRKMHARNASTNTILYSPVKPIAPHRSKPPSRSVSPKKRATASRPETSRSGGAISPNGRRTPKRPAIPRSANIGIPSPAGRPALPPRHVQRSVPNISALLDGRRNRLPSFNAQALDLASDLGDNRHGPDIMGAVPASFSTQLEMALTRQRLQEERQSDERANRIMLARMGALEQGFREVVREVKEWRREGEESKIGSRIGSGAVSRAGSKRSSLGGDVAPGTAAKKKGKSKARPAEMTPANVKSDGGPGVGSEAVHDDGDHNEGKVGEMHVEFEVGTGADKGSSV